MIFDFRFEKVMVVSGFTFEVCYFVTQLTQVSKVSEAKTFIKVLITFFYLKGVC